MSKISAIRGAEIPKTEPDNRLVLMFEDLLAKSKTGELKSFIGAGFADDGARISAWGDTHPNFYEMLGSLVALATEYQERHPKKD